MPDSSPPCPAHPEPPHPAGCYVYILECRDGSFYVGHACDPEARAAAHNAGRGASWTAARRQAEGPERPSEARESKGRPVTLAYTEPHETEAQAMRRERQLERWTRAKKAALAAGDLRRLHSLSKRRRP